MEIGSTFLITDITDWWCPQEEAHSYFADLYNVQRDILPFIPRVVGVEACSSHGWDVTSWRWSKTTGETFREKLGVRHFAWANNGMLDGDDPALYSTNTENDSEIKREAEERELHRMVRVHDVLEMWQGRQNDVLPRWSLAHNTSRWQT